MDKHPCCRLLLENYQEAGSWASVYLLFMEAVFVIFCSFIFFFLSNPNLYKIHCLLYVT